MNEFVDPFAGTSKAATRTEYGIDNTTPLGQARSGMLFEENGLYGLKDENGIVTFPAKYSFIGKCKDHVLLLEPNGSYVIMRNGCTESGFMPKKERPYVKNGKAGIKIGRKIIIPAEYDYIERKFGDTVFYAVKDGREMYLNDKGHEVLTRVRRFEGEKSNSSPFWLCTNYFDYFTVMDHVGRPKEDNPNVVQIDGCWVELERYCKQEIMDMLVDPEDDLSVTEDGLGELNSKFSYEYSFYFANANGRNRLDDCIGQFRKMNAFRNSWYYIVKIWMAPGQMPNARTLRLFIRKLKDTMKENGLIGNPIFAIGHSPSLKKGEVRMLMVTCYNERCFPPQFEFEWYDKCRDLPISSLKTAIPTLHQDIEENIVEEYKQEVFQSYISQCINDLKYYPEQTWEEAEDALECFLKLGSEVKMALFNYMKQAATGFSEEGGIGPKTEFFLRAAKWILGKTEAINVCDTSKKVTTLDLFNSILIAKQCKDSPLLDELRSTLLAKGAVYYAERESNKDYFKELDYLKNCDIA